MLFLGERAIGILSGGCLEADLRTRAEGVFEHGKALIHTYELDQDGDIIFGYGEGCPGTIKVLLEPLRGPQGDVELSLLLGASGGVCFDKTLLLVAKKGEQIQVQRQGWYGDEDASMGPRVFVDDDHEKLRKLPPGSFSKTIQEFEISGLVQASRRPVDLHLFGAGADAQVLFELACFMGWDVTIYDHRRPLLDFPLFDQAKAKVLTDHEGPISLEVHDRTACVLMTHHFLRDVSLLERLLEKEPPYLGMIGSSVRRTFLEESLKERQMSLPETVYSPIGLKLGGRDPESIALSIVAQIQQKFNGA